MTLGRVQVVPAVRWADVVADWLTEHLVTAPGDRVSVALAGGSTPQAVYRRLASPPRAARVPWSRLDLFVGDERAVPGDDSESNMAQALAALGAAAKSPGLRVFRPAMDGDLDAAAAAYAALLPAAFDLVLLGLGGDGHIASLFPGSAALTERERRVLAVVGPKPPPRRVTITPLVIGAARQVVVLVTGTGKAVAVERALIGGLAPERCPAQLVRHGLWFLDDAAGARLPRETR